LRMKAEKHLGRLFDKYVLGLDNQAPAMSEQEKRIYVVYGLARFLYRMIIVVSIGLFLYSIFEPLGIFMWATSLYGMVVAPVWKRGKELARQYRAGRVRTRYLLVIAAVVAVAVGLWFVPIDYTIDAPCVVAPSQLNVVRTAVPGRVEEVLVHPGDAVEHNQPLVRMVNPELRHRAAQVRALISETDARLRKALATDPTEYKILQGTHETLTEELNQLEKDIGRLTLRAPQDGIVVNLHHLEIKAAAQQHDFLLFPKEDAWSELADFAGTYLAAGTGILGVSSTGGIEFETFVNEHDMSELQPGNSMVFTLRSSPLAEFESQVRSMIPVDVKAIENVGITLADVGYIPVKPTADGRKEPLVTLYLVRSALVQNDQPLQWGLTGKARITYGSGPMGSFHFGRIVRGLKLRLQAVTS